MNKPLLAKIDQAPQTLRDIVQDRMRTAIIEGHFAPGQRLVERPLCDQLGVSRTVVRETIRYLEAEGLVDIIPHKGPIVARLDWGQAQQIYDIRRQLEGNAAAVCAQVYDSSFKGDLRDALQQIERSMKSTEWIDVMKATTTFYGHIFNAAGHDMAWDIVQRLNGRISRLRTLTLSDKTRATPGITHMTRIHDAILSRDAQAAQSAVEAHIADAAAVAKQVLAKDEESRDA